MQDRGILIILCLEYAVFLLVQFLKCSETILPPCPVQKVILSKKEEGHLAASDPELLREGLPCIFHLYYIFLGSLDEDIYLS